MTSDDRVIDLTKSFLIAAEDDLCVCDVWASWRHHAPQPTLAATWKQQSCNKVSAKGWRKRKKWRDREVARQRGEGKHMPKYEPQ